jgi:dTDP-4-dehydrorhamnose reductase
MVETILITGAGGQLGRALQETLAGRDLVALAHADLDIAELERVRECVADHRPALVLNAAAYNAVDAAEEDQAGAFRGNALGPRNLALATAAAEIPLLHVSSDYVFDGRGDRPYHEYDRPAPRTVYGASKLAGETAVRELNRRHYVVRTAWLYHSAGNNFANTITGIRGRPEVRVVSDQIGSPTYVPHLAEGIARLIESEAFGTYHIVNRGAASWFDFTVALYESMDLGTPVVPVTTEEFPRPAERPRYSVLTTIQQPRIDLPDWREGVAAFARAKAALAR